MDARDWLATPFEENRAHLRGVAYRMLGSLSEAEDAVQETWLRLSRSDTREVANLKAWLTTVVARVCLDMLRSRRARPDAASEVPLSELIEGKPGEGDPEQEALLADSVGIALLVVLETLGPAERLAFVLHDLFALPFEEIAPIVGRTPEAARQLASRARRRVRGAPEADAAAVTGQRKVVEAFLAALRSGDVEGLVAVLDPELVVHATSPEGVRREIHGARTWATGAVTFSRFAPFIRPALVDGTVGVVMAPRGHLYRALRLTFAGARISGIDVVADPTELRQLEVSVLEQE